jgi:hypothetical protein
VAVVGRLLPIRGSLNRSKEIQMRMFSGAVETKLAGLLDKELQVLLLMRDKTAQVVLACRIVQVVQVVGALVPF